MIQTEQLEVEKKETADKDFIQYRLERTDGGISLFVKSERFEEFIRKITPNPQLNDRKERINGVLCSNNPGWENKYGYNYPNHSRFNSFHNWGGKLMINDHSANMSFLLVKDLKDGVTFNFNGLYTNSTLKAFVKSFREEIINIYRDFLKPYGEELVIKYKEM